MTTTAQTVKTPKALQKQLFTNIRTNNSNFLPQQFRGNIFAAMDWEARVCNIARQHDQNYTGGQWRMAKTENSFFMYPTDDKAVYCLQGCHFSAEVDNVMFGILCSIIGFYQQIMVAERKNQEDAARFYFGNYEGLKDNFYKAIQALIDQGLSDAKRKELEQLETVFYKVLD